MSLESSHIAHAQNRLGLGCHGLLHGRNVAVCAPAPALLHLYPLQPAADMPNSAAAPLLLPLLVVVCGQEVVPVSIGC